MTAKVVADSACDLPSEITEAAGIEVHPDARIFCVDSLCASGGQGRRVLAADRIVDAQGQRVIVSHGDCADDAERLIALLKERAGFADVLVTRIRHDRRGTRVPGCSRRTTGGFRETDRLSRAEIR